MSILFEYNILAEINRINTETLYNTVHTTLEHKILNSSQNKVLNCVYPSRRKPKTFIDVVIIATVEMLAN